MTPEVPLRYLVRNIEKFAIATDGNKYYSLRIVEDTDDGIVDTKYAYAYFPGNQAQYKAALKAARAKADELERKWCKKMKLPAPVKRRNYTLEEVEEYKNRKGDLGKLRNQGIYAA